MSVKRFDKIVKELPQRAELAADWARQRATAREFCRRFEEGSDTQLLGDQVGMGKTYVAMAVIANTVLDNSKNGSKALLITPQSAVLRSKWEQELRSFSGSYLLPGVKGALKPLVVDSFWDLVANLHDHDDTEVLRISDGKYKCILHSLWWWAIEKGWVNNKQYWWPELEKFDWASAEAMKFESEFSSAAWWAFLEKRNAEDNDSLHKLLKPKGGMWNDPAGSTYKVKNLFKDFALDQDAYEPNVFILGMNALGRPKSNSYQNQQFATFALAVLLKGRWKDTWEYTLKSLQKSTNSILAEADVKMLTSLSNADLFRTRHLVSDVLQDDKELEAIWQQLLRDPDGQKSSTIRDFFSALLERVVAAKLKESGIKLAVVDEVHNWKSGANGARSFKNNFAPAIDHKLLMSATPFQLDKVEMHNVFEYAYAPQGRSSQVLDEIYAGESLLDKCIEANGRLYQSLRSLDADNSALLLAPDLAGLPLDGLDAGLQLMARDAGASPGIQEFVRKAFEYRQAVDALLLKQRQIMIRHVKSRDHRSFHAGKEFAVKTEGRHAMYKVPGFTSPKHAFINLLAMRLDQRIRGDATPDKAQPANARLVRGMSSSLAAFRDSSKGAAKAAAGLPAGTRDYMKLFEDAVVMSRHPKVSATVEHALQNYEAGRKTLIFCERVATAREIEELLQAEIERALGADTEDFKAPRKKIVADHLFSDMQWYRSWTRLGGGGRVSVADGSTRNEAIAFVQSCLRRASTLATPRRILRLLDLWFLRAEFRTVKRGVAGETALAFLAALTDNLECDVERGEVLAAVLNPQGEATLDEEAATQSIEEVLANGFINGLNLWSPDEGTAFDKALWSLVESEAIQFLHGPVAAGAAALVAGNFVAYYSVLLGLQTGLRKVVLRPDLLRRTLPAPEGKSSAQAVLEGATRARGGESIWKKVTRFLEGLEQANGTINSLDKTNTQRRSLWRGVELKEDPVVVRLDGEMGAERRVVVCAAFNSPLAPDILVCTAIGSEGIDLHKECSEVIHHDLPWNPARLEQRIGRLDRVGRLGEASSEDLRIGIPFLAHDYDQYQYEKVLSRGQLFELLLGTPDFDLSIDEEDYQEGAESAVIEIDSEKDAPTEKALPILPDNLVQWLSVDLSFAGNTGIRQH